MVSTLGEFVKEKSNISQLEGFYRDYKEASPSMVLILIILSVGFYIINWIFVQNKAFEEIDPEAPDSKRGAVLLFMFPLSWFMVSFFIKFFILKEPSLIYRFIEIAIWIIVFLLIGKYLYDFCISYGHVTFTNGNSWFLFLMLGMVGIAGIILGYIALAPLIFFLAITISAMQAELNRNYAHYKLRIRSLSLYN